MKQLRPQAFWLGLLLLLPACAKPVSVKEVGAGHVHRTLTRNVLTTGKLSDPTLQVVHRRNLANRLSKDPEGAIEQLHAGLEPENTDRLFALAELSFQYAKQSGRRDHYLSAAVYAYAFLFPDDRFQRPRRFDPRLRVAADLYNRGLTEGMGGEDGADLDPRPRQIGLPFGTLALRTDPKQFQWGRYRLMNFTPLAEFDVQGIRNRYRRPGIGAPLAAEVENPSPHKRTAASYRRVPADVRVPVTAFLRIPRPRYQVLESTVHADLELYTGEEETEIEVGGESVQVEYEASSSLAYILDAASFDSGALRGFFSGEPEEMGSQDGLLMLQPYRIGRIPVVLIHGTASSPAWWAEMLNELGADPKLATRYQFWLFRYNTGNPVLYSAGLLTAALRAAVRELDPDGTDPALRRMVVIGHSQGGLLAKLTVADSGDAFWNRVSSEPLEQLDLKPRTRELLKRSFYYRPLPFVDSVIFMATPHQGSFRATTAAAGVLRFLMRLPLEIASLPVELAQQVQDSQLETRLRNTPHSVDDMRPGTPFIETLASLPIAPGVHAHSIIAVNGDGPLEDADDGVVKYASAHLEAVESELVVRSNHSVQLHPTAIYEVDRILREHLARAR